MASTSIRQFPTKVPTMLAGEADFESGYTINTVEGLTNYTCLLCCLCKKVPKQPFELDICGHIFCRSCLIKLEEYGKFSTKQFGQCSMCDKEIYTSTKLLSKKQPTALARIFHSLIIHCKHGCGYKSGPVELDEHEIFGCKLRPIKCPNFGCEVVMPAEKLITEHFQNCQSYKVYCNECFLPVTISELDTHNCLQRIRDALNDYYIYFKMYHKLLPPSSTIGQPGTEFFDIPIVNRAAFLKD